MQTGSHKDSKTRPHWNTHTFSTALYDAFDRAAAGYCVCQLCCLAGRLWAPGGPMAGYQREMQTWCQWRCEAGAQTVCDRGPLPTAWQPTFPAPVPRPSLPVSSPSSRSCLIRYKNSLLSLVGAPWTIHHFWHRHKWLWLKSRDGTCLCIHSAEVRTEISHGVIPLHDEWVYG